MLNEEEKDVIDELYRRLTRDKWQQLHPDDTTGKFIEFWMVLQRYRKWWVTTKTNTEQTAHLGPLDNESIQQIKQEWEWYEAWWDLRPNQMKKHKPSIYNAMFHERSGWGEAGNAVLRFQIPEVCLAYSPEMPATDYVRALAQFAHELVEWLKTFAKDLASYWKSEDYKKARKMSGMPIDRKGLRSSHSRIPHFE